MRVFKPIAFCLSIVVIDKSLSAYLNSFKYHAGVIVGRPQKSNAPSPTTKFTAPVSLG